MRARRETHRAIVLYCVNFKNVTSVLMALQILILNGATRSFPAEELYEFAEDDLSAEDDLFAADELFVEDNLRAQASYVFY